MATRRNIRRPKKMSFEDDEEVVDVYKIKLKTKVNATTRKTVKSSQSLNRGISSVCLDSYDDLLGGLNVTNSNLKTKKIDSNTIRNTCESESDFLPFDGIRLESQSERKCQNQSVETLHFVEKSSEDEFESWEIDRIRQGRLKEPRRRLNVLNSVESTIPKFLPPISKEEAVFELEKALKAKRMSIVSKQHGRMSLDDVSSAENQQEGKIFDLCNRFDNIQTFSQFFEVFIGKRMSIHLSLVEAQKMLQELQNSNLDALTEAFSASAVHSDVDILKVDAVLSFDRSAGELCLSMEPSLDTMLDIISDFHQSQPELYHKAYMNMLVPDILTVYVEAELFTWDPLTEKRRMDSFSFFKKIEDFEFKVNANFRILPSIVLKCFERHFSNSLPFFFPYSVHQNTCLCFNLLEIQDFLDSELVLKNLKIIKGKIEHSLQGLDALWRRANTESEFLYASFLSQSLISGISKWKYDEISKISVSELVSRMSVNS